MNEYGFTKEGEVYIGDQAVGNYSAFEEDGTLRFEGEAVVWDDEQVKIGNIGFGASAPSWVDYKGSRALSFDKAQDNKITFDAQFHHTYKEGSDVEFHIHLAYPDNGAGTSRWTLTISWANVGGTFPAESSYSATITSPEETDHHQLAVIVATLPGAGKKISSVALCSLTREGTDVINDTYDEDLYLVQLDFHRPGDTAGSRTRTVK